eukprot:3808578-Pleurochrysis_carterae.AAC.1
MESSPTSERQRTRSDEQGAAGRQAVEQANAQAQARVPARVPAHVPAHVHIQRRSLPGAHPFRARRAWEQATGLVQTFLRRLSGGSESADSPLG